MFILFLIAGALNVFSMVVQAAQNNPGAAVGGIISLLFAVGFAVVSWRSYAAIPQYLSTPAWCQELLVAAEL